MTHPPPPKKILQKVKHPGTADFLYTFFPINVFTQALFSPKLLYQKLSPNKVFHQKTHQKKSRTKLFSWICFYKIPVHHKPILLILFYNVLCYRKALNNDGNKWLLLGVSPKTRFLDVQKIQKAPPPQKKNTNILWLFSAKWCFQKKQACCPPFQQNCRNFWTSNATWMPFGI